VHIGEGQEPAVKAVEQKGSHTLASMYKPVRDARQALDGDGEGAGVDVVGAGVGTGSDVVGTGTGAGLGAGESLLMQNGAEQLLLWDAHHSS